ncbi:MAG: hypothetical protein L0Y66_08300 [Myxococcaceae bacterium]|nr:hypothetical protein [Myxococcaceae bacterium]MCI0671250.1 hypothetical protein [Myxococcaceae bacterium]
MLERLRFWRRRRIVLGTEYDAALLIALRESLSAEGGRLEPVSFTVGGSQEVSVWTVRCADGTARLEAETFVGLSLSGP